jgi:ApeA-like protein/HEPN superfamily Apea-like protein
MSSSPQVGEWFLPNGKKYPGQITENKESGTVALQIFAEEYIEGAVISFPNDRPIRFHKLILGVSSDHVTLYNCYLVSASLVGKGLFKIEYNIEFLIWGTHFFEEDSIVVASGTFSFPYLSTWYDGDLFLDKLDGRQGEFSFEEDAPTNVLMDEHLTINEELELLFQDEVKKSIVEMSVSYKVEYKKYLTFRYKNSVPFTRLLKDAITFRKLLEFSFSKPLRHQILNVTVERGYVTDPRPEFISTSDFLKLDVYNTTLHGNKPIEKSSSHSNYMLISAWNYDKKEVNDIIVKWFENEQYSNIYEYYLDSNNWFQESKTLLTNIMFNNRFLSLIQGIEDYYRENFEIEKTKSDRDLFDEKKAKINSLFPSEEKELKNWFNNTFKFTKYPKLDEKIQTILDDLRLVDFNVLKNVSLNSLSASATKYRNNLSHGKNKEIDQGSDFHSVFLIAQILLAVCILRSLGVDKIDDRISRNLHFLDKIREIQIRQSLSNKEKNVEST